MTPPAAPPPSAAPPPDAGALAALGAADLRAVMGGYRDALRLHQSDINRLNVYPVPDGDTGTNMALTLEAVVAELDTLDAADTPADLPAVCRAIGHGSLMGARGNSGVILSQLLRGMSERMTSAGPDGVGPELLADAITHASELARKAVVRPVEGTILTVASAAATGATDSSPRRRPIPDPRRRRRGRPQHRRRRPRPHPRAAPRPRPGRCRRRRRRRVRPPPRRLPPRARRPPPPRAVRRGGP